jgi:hypothetical protein
VADSTIPALAASLKSDLPFEPIEILRGFDSHRL